jgi:hypothetical protein
LPNLPVENRSNQSKKEVRDMNRSAKRATARKQLNLLLLVFLATSVCPQGASGAQFYVSPSGTPTAQGTKNDPWDLQTALSQPQGVQAGDTIWLRGGTYNGNYISHLTGIPSAPIFVRQFPGERAVIDGSTPLFEKYPKALIVHGASTWYWGFEITNSDPQRVSPDLATDRGRGSAIESDAPNAKFINLILHDTGQGLALWIPGTDAEANGNIIYNNGWEAPDRGHGHGIYTQNQDGTKLIADNIVWGNFGGYGIHAFGTDQTFLRGYDFEGNVVFSDLWLVGGDTAIARITAANNFLYGTGFMFGYNHDLINQDITVKNNYVFASNPITSLFCSSVSLTGNTFVGQPGPSAPDGTNISLYVTQGADASNYTIDSNKWYRGLLGSDQLFAIFNRGGPTQTYNFAQWQQQLGFDRNGAYFSDSDLNKPDHPSGPVVFVRPNKYEPGRANIIVYNWDLAKKVRVDLSSTGLKVGDHFEIRDAENYLADPIVTGQYDGSTVRIPMKHLVAASPIGNATLISPHTAPQFGVFVVVPQ